MTDALLELERPARPHLGRLVREISAFFRPARSSIWAQTLARAPRGDGHAVLVLPPALHGDPLTEGIRQFFDRLNYQVYGWGLGPNLGPSARLVAGAQARLAELAHRHGPVSIVGYSMGGLFARWLAHEMPDQIRQVITVSTPFRHPLGSCTLALAPLVWRWSGERERALAALMSQPIPVPGTYLYTRRDGIVAWRSCLETNSASEDNIEFDGSHVTIVSNPSVAAIVAERLARQIPTR